MAQAMFCKGDCVLFQATNDVGQVADEPIREYGETFYSVLFRSGIKKLHESDLAPLASDSETLQSLAAEGRWGQLSAVRTALAIERIRHTNSSTIYAYQNQRVLFQSYQYKPLLKMLESPDRRLLIADEVGLGKTIEAGLILTELEARQSLDSVLIVCPSRLREKWKNELSRKFNQDFDIFDGRSFEEKVRDFTQRPAKSKIRGIISMQAMRTKRARNVLLGELENVDLVIVDEAHHGRNATSQTHVLLRNLCEAAHAMVFLTATPVQLDNRDLFNLLAALRPTEFREPGTFDALLADHAPLHQASVLARTQDPTKVPLITKILRHVLVDGRCDEAIDPLARQLIESLETAAPTKRDEWVAIERSIQDLHPLGTILTRTRKRDVIPDAPERIAMPNICSWTAEEDEAYQRIVNSSGRRGWFSSSLSWGQITRARQAASCLPAAYASCTIGKRDDDSTELTDILPSEIDSAVSTAAATGFNETEWSGPDSKFDKFDEILRGIWTTDEPAKVLVFSYFKGTVQYLEKRLQQMGIKALRIDGSVTSDPRNLDRDERGKRIAMFKDDPSVKVLVSTEVGSEGLDFQFCHHLVNYDLPWNPMVVEQRIGRIDRLGQKSDKIYIHNLVMSGTVEDQILNRLYQRIGIFERSVGSLEAIIGDHMKSLLNDYRSGKLSVLTEEEKHQRADQAANAISRNDRMIEELSEKASQLFGHEEHVREELRRVRKHGQYVSNQSMMSVLETYFRTKHPSVKIDHLGEDTFAIKVTDELRMDVQDAARKQDNYWSFLAADQVLRFTTSGEVAFEHADLQLINPSHPLMQAAIEGLSEQMSSATARLGAAHITLDPSECPGLDEGDYFIALLPQQVFGIRERRLIETIAVTYPGGRVVDTDCGRQLISMVVEQGQQWTGEAPPMMPDATWTVMENESLRRMLELKRRETIENEAMHVRKRNSLIAEHEYHLSIKTRRLKTNEIREQAKAAQLNRAQIEKAVARHRDEIDKLDERKSVRVSNDNPIAICAVRVFHQTGNQEVSK